MANTDAHPHVSEAPLMCYNWLCPYVHRVSLALTLKKAQIAEVAIDLSNKPAWLPQLSPLGKVPAITYLENGEQQVLYESLALMSWVDEYYKGPALMPESPAKRALARIIIARFDGTAVTKWYQMLRSDKIEEFSELLKVWHTEMEWLEKHLDSKGPFFMGATPGLVDAAVGPWLLRIDVLQHWRAVNLLAGHPKLSAWLATYRALPEVTSTFRQPAGQGTWNEAMAQAYKGYGKTQLDFSSAAAK
eukprot:CAMPEP_0119107276 /NCGR_PEP_ID=MMETSP1180-20130426/9612_1 /TAXON_ID=3052 ORGANISM="Chlamydomonas cf sp, Strain CCMP681" /NCGR_SAMPLE_ID=MMETSP1180 /ASSEMBLY_ACC=CAM_ASM_000741 /LENGTH=245 /DNA_ID=CAMNT_0007092739 /DNA_START=79 /DNA_END=816 /DNA_ORIENTATION=-